MKFESVVLIIYSKLPMWSREEEKEKQKQNKKVVAVGLGHIEWCRNPVKELEVKAAKNELKSVRKGAKKVCWRF